MLVHRFNITWELMQVKYAETDRVRSSTNVAAGIRVLRQNGYAFTTHSAFHALRAFSSPSTHSAIYIGISLFSLPGFNRFSLVKSLEKTCVPEQLVSQALLEDVTIVTRIVFVYLKPVIIIIVNLMAIVDILALIHQWISLFFCDSALNCWKVMLKEIIIVVSLHLLNSTAS